MQRKTILLAFGLAAVVGLGASNGHAASILDEWSSVKAPPAPPPVKEAKLDPKTTALLMLDFLKQNCGSNPRCTATLPRVQKLLAAARANNMLVIYTKYPSPSPNYPAPTVADILPQVAPLGNEPVITAILDKFDGTDLDKVLKDKGIKSVIVVGSVSNGAVMYTGTTAFFRGYQPIIPVDGMSSRDSYVDQFVVFNFASAPLMAGHAVLTRTDMIKF